MTKRTNYINQRYQRGGTLLEFTFVATTFFMMLLAITSGANLYFVHNALVEATRRAARYASTQAASNPPGVTYTTNVNTPCDAAGPRVAAIKNFAVYGNGLGTGTKLVSTLQPENFCVHYDSFGVGAGSVSVSVINYNYYFVVPFISKNFLMLSYRTTVKGESAGTTPANCP